MQKSNIKTDHMLTAGNRVRLYSERYQALSFTLSQREENGGTEESDHIRHTPGVSFPYIVPLPNVTL